MPAPEITPLPPAPSRLDEPATFVSKADAMLSALPDMVGELNAIAVFVEEQATNLDEATEAAQAWAEGAEPGGPGTESAKGWAVEAAASASSIADVSEEVKVGLGLGASAVRMIEASGSISPSVFRAFVPTNGVTYEFPVEARAQGTARYLTLFNNSTSTPINITFDLLAGTFIATSGAGLMRYLGGGFYECIAIVTSTGTANGNWQARPSPAGVFPFTGNTAEGLWIKSIKLRVQGTTTNLFPSSDPANAAFTKTSLTATPGTTPEQRTTEQVASIDGRLTSVETLAATTAASYASTALSRVPRVIVEGDSIMAANANPTFGTEFGVRDARGELNWAFARFPYFEMDQWGDASDATHYSSGCIVAVGGNQAQAVIDRTGTVSNLAGDIIALAIGINDINSGALAVDTMPKIQAICEYYTSLGWRVLLANLRPVGAAYGATDWSTGSQRYLQRIALNGLIKAYAATNPLVYLVDLAAAYEDPANPERPYAGETYDELHPNRTGAGNRGGPAWEAALRKMIKPLVKYIPTGTDVMVNGDFVGTGGTATTANGITGQVATGWVVNRTFGDGTVVCSKDANDDQVLTITPGGAAAMIIQISRQFGSNPLVQGKWYQAYLHCTLQNTDGWRAIRFQADDNMDGFGPFVGSGGANIYTAKMNEGGELWIPTFHHTPDAGGESASPLIHIIIDGTIGHTLTMTIHKIACVEVADPRPLHGF